MDQLKAQLLKFESKLPDPIRQTLKGLGARWQAASRKTQWVVVGVGGSLVFYLVIAGNEDETNNAITFTAVRGDLEITVLEGVPSKLLSHRNCVRR